jgi:L-amino acid N-acyltransferase YncA
MNDIHIRRATHSDLPAITEIYNDAILHTTATFDTQPKTGVEQLASFEAHDERHPVLVAVLEGQVAGWVSLSRWSDRCAYADTAEVSAYVRAEHRGCRIGSRLMTAIVQEARRVGLHTLLARIVEGNEASLRLCLAAGFVLVGTMKEVGWKFGRRLDVHLLQKVFD